MLMLLGTDACGLAGADIKSRLYGLGRQKDIVLILPNEITLSSSNPSFMFLADNAEMFTPPC